MEPVPQQFRELCYSWSKGGDYRGRKKLKKAHVHISTIVHYYACVHIDITFITDLDDMLMLCFTAVRFSSDLIGHQGKNFQHRHSSQFRVQASSLCRLYVNAFGMPV